MATPSIPDLIDCSLKLPPGGKSLGLQIRQGADDAPEIFSISPGGPASKSPLKVGHRILAFDGRRVRRAKKLALQCKRSVAKKSSVNFLASTGPLPPGATYVLVKVDAKEPLRAYLDDGSLQGLFLDEEDDQVVVTGIGQTGIFAHWKINKRDIILAIDGYRTHTIEDCERALKLVSRNIIAIATYRFAKSTCKQNTIDELSAKRAGKLFKIGSELESGEFFKVVKCRARSTRKTCAMKIFNRDSMSESDEVALHQEVAILNELDHPHILSLVSAFSTNQSYHLVTELLEGGGLFDRMIGRKTYTENEARSVSRKLLHALEHCHEKRIAHRDLRPENILLTSKDDDCQIKLAGFGSARKAPTEDSLETMCGHPFFISPEILTRNRYGTKTDVWSLGVIIFILLGGYPPFLGDDNIIHCEFRFVDKYWNYVSEEAKSFIKSLLVVSPRQRLSANAALDHPWMKINGSILRRNSLVNTQENLKFNSADQFKSFAEMVMPAVSKRNSLAIPKSIRRESNEDQLSSIGDGIREIGTELTSGEFCKVVKAETKSNGKNCAMITVNRDSLSESDEAALQREIAIMNELDHPNILRLVSSFSTYQSHYLVTEQLKGCDLFESMIKRTTYTENEVRHVSRILLSALEYCHDKCIAHRDIQHTNILSSSRGKDCTTKIVGFESARKAPKEDSLETMCGHPIYMSPEMVKGHRYGIKTDVFSLGVIIFTLLGGYPPFFDRKYAMEQNYVFLDEYWGSVSAEARFLVELLLVAEPRQRLSASEALGHPWIKADEVLLRGNNLKHCQEHLKFNVANKFKSIGTNAMTLNKTNDCVSVADSVLTKECIVDVDELSPTGVDEFYEMNEALRGVQCLPFRRSAQP